MRFLKTNTATRVTVGPFLDPTDGVTPVTSLTVTNCHLTLVVDDGGVPTLVLDTTATASGGDNDMVHITGDDAGYFDLELAAADVDYLGRASLAITDAANHCPVFHEFMIVPANVYDSMFLGTDVLNADVTQVNGTNVSGSTPDVNVASIASEVIAEVIVAMLKQDFTGITGEATASMLNAMRKLTNKVAKSGSTLHIKKEDGTTDAFTQTITTDAAALPITGLATD